MPDNDRNSSNHLQVLAATKKSRLLLEEIIGPDYFQDFESGLEIVVGAPDGTIYRMRDSGISKLARNRIVVTKTDMYKTRSGALADGTQLFDMYDSVSTFIMLAKINRVNWGCGLMNFKFPRAQIIPGGR